MGRAFRTELLIVLAALVLFMPGLGAVHLFDWDEINFAEIAREMIVTGDYMRPQVDYQPFWEKPPLFMWMQAASMHLFGVGEFAARFPDAVCGVVTLLVLYRIGRRLRDHLFGVLWVLAYLGSVLPHLYFRSGIIDPWFNLFIFLGIHAFILLAWDKREGLKGGWKHAVLSGLFLGLATLTKGPTALLILGLSAGVYWVWGRFRLFVRIPQVLLMLGAAGVVCFGWFGVDWLVNGSWFLDTFVKYQYRLFSTPDAGHGGFLGYHFVVLLIGCFPASLFLVHELVRPTRGTARDNDYRRWMVVLFWVVLILFTIVKSKIVHYSSMCYFPLTYLAALKLHRLWRGEEQAPRWLRTGLGIIGSLFAFVTLTLPFVAKHGERLKPFIADPFGRANLDAPVHWTGLEALAGVWMVIVLFLGHRFFARSDYKRGLSALFGGTALFVTITLFFFINNIEGYSQRTAITFFEQRQGEACFVITKNYRSYAHLFYTRKPPVTDTLSYSEEWLYHGPIDRPVYMSAKITAAEEARAIGTFREIGAANGFVFFRRDP